MPVRPGTINILLFFNVDLSRGALARALVTCTEAQTAALQELLAPSRYFHGAGHRFGNGRDDRGLQRGIAGLPDGCGKAQPAGAS